jgi:hypothetical protein
MSYFNHAFRKCFLGTGVTRDNGTVGAESPTNPWSTGGFITTSLSPSSVLADLGAGYFGFYDKDTYLSVAEGDLTPGECCPLVLASSSLKLNDKQGPFHGGYKESNKSKYINPKLVRQFYRVNNCTPQQNIVHVGDTNFTGTAAGAAEQLDQGTITQTATAYTPSTTFSAVATTGGTGTGLLVDVVVDSLGTITAITTNSGGSGYSIGDVITIDGSLLGGTTPGDDVTIEILTVATAGNADCIIPFYCDETYYLRLEVKGSPALRFANHNLYQTLQADGGCCDGPVPTEVDGTLIMIQWAKGIVENPFFVDFIQPIVFDEAGNPWFADAATAVAYGSVPTQIWDNYVSPGHTPGAGAGIRLLGAYVDTTFGNCTFMVTDHYEKEPIRILASLVDYNGDPCVFEGLCVIEECPALQGMGFGEQVARDLIMSESYLQNFFATDLRVREITQGTNILDSVDRASMYVRYFIQHTVPRFNNPTGVFDNDQYLLDVIVPGDCVQPAPNPGDCGNAAFESFMATWLGNCGDECTTLVVNDCEPCVPVAVPIV